MNKQQNCKVCLRSQVSIGKKCSKEDVAYSISLLSGRWRKTPQESTLENLTRYQKCWALEKGTPSKCGIFWDCFIEIKTDVWFSISDRNTEAVPDCSLALAQLNKSRKQRSWSTWLGEDGPTRTAALEMFVSHSDREAVCNRFYCRQINLFGVFSLVRALQMEEAQVWWFHSIAEPYQARHVHTKAKIAEKFGNKAQMG